MQEPRVSEIKSCPECSSDDWKLAKVIFSNGTSRISGEANGGGFGVGAGVGRGQGGIVISYQGVNLDIELLQMTASAREHMPPPVPARLDEKARLLSRCEALTQDAADWLRSIDDQATRRDTIESKWEFRQARLASLADFFSACADSLRTIRDYEERLALWERSKVCQRCGTAYISVADRNAAKVAWDVPAFLFVGQSRHCPRCEQYEWIRPELYWNIERTRQEKRVDDAKLTLERAIERDNDPKPGLFRRLGKKWKLVPTTLEAQTSLVTEETALAELTARQQYQRESHQDLDGMRVCIKCGHLYKEDGR